MRIFQNLKQINILTFWEIAEEDNFLLMDMDFQEGKEYSEEEKEVLKAGYLKLYDDYFKAKDDNNQKGLLRENDEMTKAKYKIYLLNELYKSLKMIEFNRDYISKEDYSNLVIEAYKNIIEVEPKFKVNEKENLNFNCNKLERIIKSLNNELQLKDTRSTQGVKKEVKAFKNVFDRIVSVEQVIERSLGDIKQISALQWIAYEKLQMDIIKKRKNERR